MKHLKYIMLALITATSLTACRPSMMKQAGKFAQKAAKSVIKNANKEEKAAIEAKAAYEASQKAAKEAKSLAGKELKLKDYSNFIKNHSDDVICRLDISKQTCPTCNGSGYIGYSTCSKCDGEGKIYKVSFKN